MEPVADGESPRRSLIDLATLLKQAPATAPTELGLGEPSLSYRCALGREVIQLGGVEFRILLFLAARPYHAFSRDDIAEATIHGNRPITAEQVDGFVSSLIMQLGPFHDYVQAVPYIGYRFKA